MMFWGLMSWTNVKASGRGRALHSDSYLHFFDKFELLSFFLFLECFPCFPCPFFFASGGSTPNNLLQKVLTLSFGAQEYARIILAVPKTDIPNHIYHGRDDLLSSNSASSKRGPTPAHRSMKSFSCHPEVPQYIKIFPLPSSGGQSTSIYVCINASFPEASSMHRYSRR